MRSKLPTAIAIVVQLVAISIAVPSAKQTKEIDANAFTYNNKTFFLHGEPYQIRAGQMDPQRIDPAYWHDRLFKAKAMGLNTIFSYVFWDLIEGEARRF